MSRPRPPTPPSVLVVDDNPSNLLAFKVALEPLARPVVTASSGVAALQRLLDDDFALILMDVQMPGMDGYETARLIRTRARNRLTPIIFVTAFDADRAAVHRAYQLGAVDFLSKPVDEDVLRAKASVFLELEAQKRQLLETAALRERMEQLAELDRRKDQMLAMLAHELRNPLMPIVTALDLIEEAGDAPVPARTRNVLRRQVGQLTRLVDDMLDLARFTSGKLEITCTGLTLEAVIEDAITTAAPLVSSRRHTLVRHPPHAPVWIHADEIRMLQVVGNLITNAAKYTPPGGQIDVAWGGESGRAFVRVTDNGRGIPPELIDRIFEPFVQERVGLDGTGGMGLGLALVHRIVALHGGEIEATSAGRDRGATFEVRLPLRAAPDQDVGRAAAAPLPESCPS